MVDCNIPQHHRGNIEICQSFGFRYAANWTSLKRPFDDSQTHHTRHRTRIYGKYVALHNSVRRYPLVHLARIWRLHQRIRGGQSPLQWRATAHRSAIDHPCTHRKLHTFQIIASLDSRSTVESAPRVSSSGEKYDIPWTVLTAIHKEETDFDCTGQDVSSAGAIGPMQFMPSTFAIFGVPAPGHQTADIHNVYDAIYSTAHMLEATGFSRDPYHAIYEYNHSVSYVRDILRMSAV